MQRLLHGCIFLRFVIQDDIFILKISDKARMLVEIFRYLLAFVCSGYVGSLVNDILSKFFRKKTNGLLECRFFP